MDSLVLLYKESGKVWTFHPGPDSITALWKAMEGPYWKAIGQPICNSIFSNYSLPWEKYHFFSGLLFMYKNDLHGGLVVWGGIHSVVLILMEQRQSGTDRKKRRKLKKARFFVYAEAV